MLKWTIAQGRYNNQYEDNASQLVLKQFKVCRYHENHSGNIGDLRHRRRYALQTKVPLTPLYSRL